MSTQPILVKKIINFSDPIPKTLLKQLEENKNILRRLKPLIPKTMKDSLIGCAKIDGTLLLFTESSAWASQLRFYSPTILQSLNIQSDLAIEKIKIKILPPTLARNRLPSKRRVASSETIKHLKNHAADQVNEELRTAIQRLVNSLEKSIQQR